MAITTQLAQILIPIMHHCLKSTDPQFKDEQLAKLLASFVDSSAFFFLFLSFLVLFTVGGGSHVAVILLIGQTPVSPPWIRLKI